MKAYDREIQTILIILHLIYISNMPIPPARVEPVIQRGGATGDPSMFWREIA